VFSNLSPWEIIVLVLLGVFIFGPERLPKVIGDGLRMVRGLRDMARNATTDLSKELGTDVSLEDLHPKTFIRKHLLSDEEQAQIRRPFDDLSRDVRQVAGDLGSPGAAGPGRERPPTPRAGDGTRRDDSARRDYDADAT
jgi:sec-independent protein translocase protein TatB